MTTEELKKGENTTTNEFSEESQKKYKKKKIEYILQEEGLSALLESPKNNGVSINSISATKEKEYEERYAELEKLTEEEFNETYQTIGERAKEKITQMLTYKKALEFYLDQKNNVAIEIIVQYLENKYVFKTITDEKDYSIFVYKKGIYKENGVSLIKIEMRNGLGKAYSDLKAKSVIERLRIDTLVDTKEFLQGTPKELTALNNGILNTITSTIIPFNPKYYFFKKIPVNYNKNADCPKIKQFIKQIVNTKDAVNTIQEMIGYTLLRDYNLETAFMLEGKTASNGKTQLINLIRNFIGSENCSNTSIADLDTRPFALIDLHAKHINFCEEISRNALNGEGKFKELVGNAEIGADRKNQTKITFLNHAKFIFTANELPIPKNADAGFWRRWIRVQFPNRFLSKKEINAIDPKERKNIFLKTLGIADKLSSKEELEGLLIWALEGLSRVLKNKEFSCMETIETQKKDWLRKALSINAFIEDCIEIDYSNTKYIVKEDFRREYNKYCQKHEAKPLSDKVIKITLENECFASSAQIRIKDERNYEIDKPRVWKGISFIKEKPLSHLASTNSTFPSSLIMSVPRKTNLQHPVTPVAPVTNNIYSFEELIQKGYSKEDIQKDLSLGFIFEFKPGMYKLVDEE